MMTNITERQASLVKDSWSWMNPSNKEIGLLFYKWLFTNYPDLRRLFRNDLELQVSKFTDMLDYLVSNLERIDMLAGDIDQLALRHCGYGTLPAHYEILEDGLLTVFEDISAEIWDEELKEAWQLAIRSFCERMIVAAQSSLN